MPKSNRKREDEEIVIGRKALKAKSKDSQKRKTEDPDRPVKKKKKKSSSKELSEVAVAALGSKRLAKRKKKLNAALDELNIEQLAKHARPGEREYVDEFVWMFNRIGRLIRKTEKRALKSGQSRDVYALSTLISQQREIIADIRTLADLSGQVMMVKDRVLQPMVSHLAQNILDTFYQLRRLIMETSNPKETQFALQRLEEMMKDQGKYLQLQYHEGAQSLEAIMSGTEPVPDAPKKKKKKSKS